MTFDFEKNAKRNEEPPAGLNLFELTLYAGLRYLYSQYRAGTITKDAASKVKAAMLAEYQTFTEKAELLDRMTGIWARIEPAYQRYKADKTTENADQFVEAVYGAKLKE